MVPASICDKIGQLTPSIRELGAEHLAQLLEQVAYAPECPTPSWPESIFIIDRLFDSTTRLVGEINECKSRLGALSDKLNQESDSNAGGKTTQA